ncbi:MAG: hypothetical protein U9Q68_09625 [Euryarchaeota archaeon]|nr:hypothetical protein [Euryarchaeota archaeon]
MIDCAGNVLRCTQIAGAAVGDLLIEGGTDEHKTLATGWLQVNRDRGYEGYVLTVRQIDIQTFPRPNLGYTLT